MNMETKEVALVILSSCLTEELVIRSQLDVLACRSWYQSALPVICFTKAFRGI